MSKEELPLCEAHESCGGCAGGLVNPTIWTDKLRATYHIRRGEEARGIVLARWGGLGNHRYQVGFSGDVNPLAWNSFAYQLHHEAEDGQHGTLLVMKRWLRSTPAAFTALPTSTCEVFTRRGVKGRAGKGQLLDVGRRRCEAHAAGACHSRACTSSPYINAVSSPTPPSSNHAL